MSITTVALPELQIIDGREEIKMSSRKRSSSASSSSDTPDSPSPQKTRKPMRKRAKTQEEKEERAHERVMRNRAAAQVSRERKREHMVFLEQENQELHAKIDELSNDNKALNDTVTSMTQRLENMERMLAFFTAPGTTTITEQGPAPAILAEASIPETSENQASYLPTPPGTVRPSDLHYSNPSTPFLESIDSRNPAVIVNGPQRRISMRFPWNLSSQSPIYRQMETILYFWTTILHKHTLQAFTNRTMTYLLTRHAPSQKPSLHSALDHWRSSATGLDARARQDEDEEPSSL